MFRAHRLPRARAERRLIISFFVRLLFATYFLETGLLLVVMPWLQFWDHNFFIRSLPMVERLLASPYTRGAVSGIGVITTIAGVLELAAAFGAWRVAASAKPRADA